MKDRGSGPDVAGARAGGRMLARRVVGPVVRKFVTLAALLALLAGLPAAAARPTTTTATIRVVLELDGPDLVPFRESYRSILVQAINATVPSINSTDITLVSVEEILPESGPNAELLSGLAARVVSGGDGPGGGEQPQPPPRPPRRALAQAAVPEPSHTSRPVHGEVGGSPDDYPHVHLSLVLEPPVPLAGVVQGELRVAVSSGRLATDLQSRGVPATGLRLLELAAARTPRSRDGASGSPHAVAALPPAARDRPSSAVIGLSAGLASAVAIALGAGVFVGVTRARRARRAAAAAATGAASLKGGAGGALTKAEAGGKGGAAADSPWAASTFAPTVRPAALGAPPSTGGKAPAPVPPVALAAGSLLTPGASGSGARSRCGSGAADVGDRSARSGRTATTATSDGGSPPPDAATAATAAVGDVPFSELALARPVGEGAFGRVFLAAWRETAVAVKLLAPRPLEEWDGVMGEYRHGGDATVNPLVGGSLSRRATADADADADAAGAAAATALLASVRREAALMARLRHPNVLQYLGTVSHPPAVISEYCPNGSVADVLARAAAGGGGRDAAALLPWSRRLGFALGAAKGMLYLHAQAPPVLHRDLKPANLLVDAGWRVKVADFNLARAAGDLDAGAPPPAGPASARSSLAAAANPRWVAPEVLAGGRATPAADVFSFGVVLWELLTCALPWAALGPWQVVLAVVERRARLPLPSAMKAGDGPPPSSPVLPDADLPPGGLPAAAAAYGALVRSCWADDPARRPDFSAVIAALRPIIAAQAAADRRRLVAPAGGAGQPGAAGAA